MAIFSNQATLTYNGNTTNSNIAYGEILDALAVTKNAVEGSYAPGDLISYVVTLRNSGNMARTGLTITDDLGGYAFGTGMLYPLTYVEGSARLFVNGVQQGAPVVSAGPPLVFSGISVPAGGDLFLVYQARVNAFANPGAAGRIVNTVTVTGNRLTAPVTATETVTAATRPALTISKAISPAQVVDNDRVTYTFVIRNSGNAPVVATDDAVISDTFDPRLTDLVVTYEGEVWTLGVEYNYNETTGLFTTNPGRIVVPAATAVQNPVTGEYTVLPGTVTLTVEGTI